MRKVLLLCFVIFTSGHLNSQNNLNITETIKYINKKCDLIGYSKMKLTGNTIVWGDKSFNLFDVIIDKDSESDNRIQIYCKTYNFKDCKETCLFDLTNNWRNTCWSSIPFGNKDVVLSVVKAFKHLQTITPKEKDPFK